MTTDPHRDFSYSTSSTTNSINIPLRNIDFESSLDSYRNFFDKAQHDFTTSSEISFVNLDDQQLENNALSTVDHNRTFTKDTSRQIINAFTGKPISPNPWQKLCTKNVQRQTESDVIVPIQLSSPRTKINQDKIIPEGQFSTRMATRQSRRDLINNQEEIDNNNDQALEPFLQEHRTPIEIKHQPNTPLQRQRKKRNSLKDVIDNSSTSSDECRIKNPTGLHPKINQLINNDSSWHRLADVYTSEESDENNISQINISYTIRFKSEIFTPDQSPSSSCSVKPDIQSTTKKENTKTCFNFVESLSERVSIEDKHPDARPYFLSSGFNLKEKRQELANKLLSTFNQDVFSSQLSDKVSVVWSGRLTATAGHCTTRRNTRTAVITLSHKVCDSPERCRDTLLHEMCHAAVTLIDGVMEQGHGPLWRAWTRKAEQSYPYLPSISVRHTYDVVYKFIYRCTKCNYEVYRHSKSLDLAVDFCGKCMGQFVLIINNNKDDAIKKERQTPKKTINKYKNRNKPQEDIQLPDFDQLKI